MNMEDVTGGGGIAGLRLKNPRFLGFLNTAVNSVVTNEPLREQVLKENTVKLWGEKVLLEHDQNFLGGIALNDEDVLRDLNVFILSPNGCTDLHGANCFVAVKKEILSKLEEIKILGELKRIVLSRENIEGTILLRSFLAQKFSVFKDDVQHDAGDAYLSLLQCLPDAANICSLKMKRTRTCVNCLKNMS